jgi:lysyl-tRNA synthetase class 1
MTVSPEVRAAANVSKAWPFEEARKLLARPGKDGALVFETGYGPSGLPHIGTFGEVARTTMVRHAFAALSDQPTRLIAFSDDMDGLRKVPDNVPNREAMLRWIGHPLSKVPDPFDANTSFGAANNARLRAFLDRFGFEYEFLSSTECYNSGRFDAALRTVLANYDAVQAIMLPTLGEERRATYNPFLPIHPETGVVEQVAILERDADAATITWADARGERYTTSVLGGHAKLQWKVDWAMRWLALGVDYEMAGKDLIDSVTQSSRIVRALGGRPPEGFNYELFLDAEGAKISKSKGNGLTIEEWLAYAAPPTLSFFMYREPRKAKRLHLDVIPRAVDEYWEAVGKYAGQPIEQQLGNPVHHVHNGQPPRELPPVSFALLLNLVAAVATSDKAVLWGFVTRNLGLTPGDQPLLDQLMDGAIAYHRDVTLPTLQRRPPNAIERKALMDLDNRLAVLPPHVQAEDIQFDVYEAGKASGIEPLREWFKALYETLLGASQGPRMGSFIALYGIAPTRALIAQALATGAAA